MNPQRALRSLGRTLAGTLAVIAVLLAFPYLARAGGPKYVAGISYFNAGTAGTPVLWPNGALNYYTDQGDLSPLLRGSDADAFVADAFSRWTAVSTAALSATHAGQLGEDVSGANVVRNPDGSITMPVDIQPSATDHPVAVVYDYDGQVTNALLGAGAGNRDACFSNAVLGGPDAFTADGSIAHALVLLNGNCIQTNNDLLESKYRLVRVLGRVLGLDWSQLNLNVLTGVPQHPTADDQAGFPLMHAVDSPNCVPITLCYPDPDHLKMDDRAAIARLYPVTPGNLAQFPGKQVLTTVTGRIHGSVYFTDAAGNPAQPMQCVNVVARWIDPATGQPSGRYAASSVSGFLFVGNAGNPVTGYVDPAGNRYDRFGSNDARLEGFFDLGALEIPQGDSAQYQVTIEALDPLWSESVGPCAPDQVPPSGSFAPVVVTVQKGGDVAQDIKMSGSALEKDDPNRNDTYTTPLPVPDGGAWFGALSGYGDADYFQFSARGARTFSIDVIALDETGQPSQNKARPLIGLWFIGDPVGSTPAVATPIPFNGPGPALTQLNVQVNTPSALRMGIADLRGDGRPDFQYRAQLLYGDSVSPSRVSVRGGDAIALGGFGFKPGMTVSVGNTLARILSISDQEILAAAPAFSDGPQTITIRNPTTGAASSLQGALQYGAAPDDTITISNGNPAIPVGTQTPYALQATVMTANGSQPVSGATVNWTVDNGAALSICGGSVCPAITDERGHAETRVSLNASGVTNVTAQLAAYSGTTGQATLVSTTDPKSISLLPFRLWSVEGMTIDAPLTARVVTSTGAPVSGLKLNFTIAAGSGTLTPSSPTTDANGYARSTLHVDSVSTEVDVVVCSASGGIACPTFRLFKVAASALRLQPVSGSSQIIPLGQSFTPLWVRVVDSSVPPNPVFGAAVTFQSAMFALEGTPPILSGNDDNSSSNHAQPVLLGSSQTTMSSDSDGYAGIIPPHGSGTRALEVDVAVTTGANAALSDRLFEVWLPATSDAEQTRSIAFEGEASPAVPRPR